MTVDEGEYIVIIGPDAVRTCDRPRTHLKIAEREEGRKGDLVLIDECAIIPGTNPGSCCSVRAGSA